MLTKTKKQPQFKISHILLYTCLYILLFILYKYIISTILGKLNITNNLLDNKIIIYLQSPQRIMVGGREIYYFRY
jgi:hypothetical protein